MSKKDLLKFFEGLAFFIGIEDDCKRLLNASASGIKFLSDSEKKEEVMHSNNEFDLIITDITEFFRKTHETQQRTMKDLKSLRERVNAIITTLKEEIRVEEARNLNKTTNPE